MRDNRAKAWGHAHKKAVASGNYSQWPNEAMLRIAFGRYLKNKIKIVKGMKVMDVGCGSGNNLLPFLFKGCKGYGVEVTSSSAKLAEKFLRTRGFKTDMRVGNNRNLPFDNNSFDLLLSINTLHYEAEWPLVDEALKEFQRVLKKGGHLILFTVGPRHTVIKKAKRVQPFCYKVQNFDFRDGTQFYCFETEKNLRKALDPLFENVETGQVTEKLMTCPLDFLIAVGQKEN